MNIREVTREDFDQVWPIFHEIAATGEIYAYPRSIQAGTVWINDWMVLRDEFEEGGYKQSGQGRHSPLLTARHCRARPVTLRRFDPALK